MQIPTGSSAPAPGPADVDVARLVRTLQQDPRPRLTWYGEGGARVELTGSGLAQWVAKTAHLLAEEADVEAGSRIRVLLGPDWRGPVFWLAAWYLGAEVDGAGEGAADAVRPDVVVVPEGRSVPDASVTVVVPEAAALPDPVADLPPGAVDYGAEVSGFPDQLPAPGPATVLRLTLGGPRRLLLGPDAGPQDVAAAWASGGSVVLHTGLDAAALGRVEDQENVDRG